jgi:phosphoesterase RecJ-like protein
MPHDQTTANSNSAPIAQICEAIRSRQRFVISSHARPDGDSIGSQLAMAFALRALGKHVEVVNQDAAPPPLMAFPGVPSIQVAERVIGEFDAAIVMECSELKRTGVEGLDRFFVINIDHHPGNAEYGAINWFDGTAAACAEMVFAVIRALDVPLSVEIATHIYVGIFDSNTLGRLKLFGAVLSSIELEHGGRLAVVCVDRAMAAASGGTYDDTEGLINLPLTVREIQAAIFLKEIDKNDYRVSMRSKGDIDLCAVAKKFGGGGHKNASGCSLTGDYDEVRSRIIAEVTAAIEQASRQEPEPSTAL